ncbi:MAG: phosphohistidine phosphatase SixA [Anaerolineae bacterium]|nr:phosphohistidine phosphatase SixA [Anaerolineae bacterium]
MRIYFLRHGEASWPAWSGPDSERPLTEKGIKEMQVVAEGIARLRPDAAVLTSPLRRAVQTAEILARALGVAVTVEPGLAPGFDTARLRTFIERYPDRDLLLVGHEPDFSTVIAALTGGNVRMAKAGFACVELTAADKLAGELQWLVPPKVFKAA